MSDGADRELIKAAVLSGLRAALAEGAELADALRACWYRHPLFASTLLSESLRLRFDVGGDVRLVTGFVARIRSAQGGKAGGFPAREAEAVIRACLGEVGLLEAVPASQFSYPELGIAILDRLFQEWQPSGTEVEGLFEQIDQALEVMLMGFPELAPGEDNWFATGMHDSPFSVPLRTSSLPLEEE